MAANGARFAVQGRDEEKIGAVVEGIGSDGGSAIGVVAEVTDFAEIERMRKRVEEEQVRLRAEAFPLVRIGTPEDVALPTLFLASESSSCLTGVTLDVARSRIML